MKKLFISFSFFLGTMLTLAQVVPPPPPEPESGEIGGGPATPIDNYIVVLLLVAIFVIAYAHRKLKTNNI